MRAGTKSGGETTASRRAILRKLIFETSQHHVEVGGVEDRHTFLQAPVLTSARENKIKAFFRDEKKPNGGSRSHQTERRRRLWKPFYFDPRQEKKTSKIAINKCTNE